MPAPELLVTVYMAIRVLVVEDEVRIAQWIKLYFEKAGFFVQVCHEGLQAMSTIETNPPDLLILDLNLPGLGGIEICRRIRKFPHSELAGLPIIMLTALVEEHDKLRGLGIGADDYVTKPFSPKELVARANSLLRRISRHAANNSSVSDGELLVDVDQHRAEFAGQPLELTATELALLHSLMQQPGRTFTRAELIDRAFGNDFNGFDRTIDAHIKNIRSKLRSCGCPQQRIETVFGLGYQYVCQHKLEKST